MTLYVGNDALEKKDVDFDTQNFFENKQFAYFFFYFFFYKFIILEQFWLFLVDSKD